MANPIEPLDLECPARGMRLKPAMDSRRKRFENRHNQLVNIFQKLHIFSFLKDAAFIQMRAASFVLRDLAIPHTLPLLVEVPNTF
jgi:hypothetical protein